ncbi:Ionotropic receptor 144 [Hyalella azteca]|uniref:Ionotropic receptor 144 n=1 Tax=Hyalella azteca TaxID=294128 RepID=A0A6A0H0S0_HYAAZ|nr:Ionotropic receptor 144 [Hyalella azteca]
MSLQHPSSSCLRVTLTEWYPFSIKMGRAYGGIAVDVLRLVAKLNRYCLTFMEPQDKFWGLRLPNGTWNGMIGQVNNSEADLSGTLIFTTESRAEVVDFSAPLYFQEHRILYKTPNLKPNIAGFLLPFTGTVWLSIAIMFIAVTVAVAILFLLYDVHYRTWGQTKGNSVPTPSAIREPGWRASHFTIGMLLSQPPRWNPNGALVVLFMTALWMFISFIVANVYRSNLVSMLVLPKIEVPFETLDELVNQHEYKIVMAAGGALEQKARESPPDSVLGKLIRNVEVSVDFDYVYQTLINKKYAGIGNEIQLDVVRHFRYSQTAQCPFTVTKKGFVTGIQMSYVFQKGSPLKPKFDKVINDLREAGLLDQFLDRALSNASHCRKKVNNSNELRALSFWDVAGMLSLFLGGIAVSTFAFLLEIFLKPDTVPAPLHRPVRAIARFRLLERTAKVFTRLLRSCKLPPGVPSVVKGNLQIKKMG